MDSRLEGVGRHDDGLVPFARRDWTEVAGEALLALPNVVKLLVRLTRDPRVSIRRKVAAAAVAAYVVAPIDLVPDLLFGLGAIDDLVLVALALALLIDGAGRNVVEEHWDGSEDALDLVLASVEWGAEILPGPLRRWIGRRKAVSLRHGGAADATQPVRR
jgi:uncharacterized membrane protein YkvA (DUF1232 family)